MKKYLILSLYTFSLLGMEVTKPEKIKVDDEMMTTLMRAININNTVYLARWISRIQAGIIDVNATTKDGMTILMALAEDRFLNLLKELLGIPGIKVNSQDALGNTALILAADQPKALKMLLSAQGIDVNIQNEKKENALMSAVVAGNLESVQNLLHAPGIEVNALDLANQSALKLALESRLSAGQKPNEAIINELLNAPKIEINQPDANGSTALAEAIMYGAPMNIIQMFLNKPNIEVNTQDLLGRTPLMWAADRGRLDVIQALLKNKKTNIHLTDKKDQNALDIAVANGQKDIVRELFQAGAKTASKLSKSQ